MRNSFQPAVLAMSLAAACIILAPAGTKTTATGRAQPAALIAFSNAWDRITGYSTTVTVFDRKGAQVQNVLFDYTFRKPTNMTVHVKSGPNAGVTLVWDGGPTMVAHKGSGLTGLFKRKISLHDPMATTLRGSSLDQLSFGAILAHARKTAGAISHARVVDVGVAVDAITIVPANPSTDVQLTREIVELSTTTHLPTRVIGYEGNALVRSIEFSNVKLDR